MYGRKLYIISNANKVDAKAGHEALAQRCRMHPKLDLLFPTNYYGECVYGGPQDQRHKRTWTLNHRKWE